MQRVRRQSPERVIARRKFFRSIMWFFVIGLILFIAAGIVSHLKSLQIDKISVSGQEVLKEEDISKKTLDILSDNFLLFFSRGNKFIYTKNYLMASLKTTFPRIKDIDISRGEGNEIVISLSEREGKYIWCGEKPPSYTDRFQKQDCYFVDETGFVFAESPYFTSGIYFTFYGGKITEDGPIGNYFHDFEKVNNLISLIELFEKEGINSHSLYIKEIGQYELFLDIYTTTGDYAKIVFSDDVSFDDIANKVILTFRSDEFSEKYKSQKSSLGYIDARFDNRIFYKFGTGEPILEENDIPEDIQNTSAETE